MFWCGTPNSISGVAARPIVTEAVGEDLFDVAILVVTLDGIVTRSELAVHVAVVDVDPGAAAVAACNVDKGHAGKSVVGCGN